MWKSSKVGNEQVLGNFARYFMAKLITFLKKGSQQNKELLPLPVSHVIECHTLSTLFGRKITPRSTRVSANIFLAESAIINHDDEISFHLFTRKERSGSGFCGQNRLERILSDIFCH